MHQLLISTCVAYYFGEFGGVNFSDDFKYLQFSQKSLIVPFISSIFFLSSSSTHINISNT